VYFQIFTVWKPRFWRWSAESQI